MLVTQIICLANSWKYGERCIAGIEPCTGKWIRPICPQYADDGRVPWETRIVKGYAEPALLDILEIPLEGESSDCDFECENWAIAPGIWKAIGKARIQDIIPHIDFHTPILHNDKRYVATAYLRALPFEQRQSLQLIYVDKFSVSHQPRDTGGKKWKATIATRAGNSLPNLTITDPEFADQLNRGYVPESPHLVTVSLSMPCKPLSWEDDDPDPCWKLVAGVIKLSLSDQILIEMQLSRWSIRKGQHHLLTTYGKKSRAELTDDEKCDFIKYLKKDICQHQDFFGYSKGVVGKVKTS